MYESENKSSATMKAVAWTKYLMAVLGVLGSDVHARLLGQSVSAGCGQVLTAANSIDGIEHVNCDSDDVDLGRMS